MQHCSSNYTATKPALRCSALHPPEPRSQTPVSLSRTGVWGKQRRFSCANVSQSAPSNHSPVFSRDRGLRHSLNNLTALCQRALGSQPSKVMTERRWLTSPPIHSHYHLFTVHDSRQTKQKGHTGEEKSLALYKLCHKAERNQTMTFSEHPQVGGDPLLCYTVK